MLFKVLKKNYKHSLIMLSQALKQVTSLVCSHLCSQFRCPESVSFLLRHREPPVHMQAQLPQDSSSLFPPSKR